MSWCYELVAEDALAYYPTNNVQAITDTVNSANSQSFSYDTLRRLSGAAGGYGSFAYTYDNDGNRLSQTHGIETTSYGYGSGSDLLATLSVGGVQTQAIGYTADGRIASLSPGIQAPGGQYITSLSYNQDARLSAVNASGGALASYTYDGFGQRLIKTVSGSYGEIYQYGQNGMVLEATNASGAAQADYIYLDGRPVATLNPSTGALYFLHDDMLGTPQLATDSSQAVAWQATYEPFGQASISGTVTQNLRFPGQYFDLESGWNHNGFRDYAPQLGRYIEPDPLGRLGSGNNLYVYVDDNPTNLIDLLGLCPVDDTKRRVVDFLKQHNPCSEYFNAGAQAFLNVGEITGPIASAVLSTDQLVPIANEPFTAVAMTSTQGSGPGATIQVNLNSPFLFPSHGQGLYHIGEELSTSDVGRAGMLLHELAHTLNMIPRDGGNPDQSHQNTQTIMTNCEGALVSSFGAN